MLARLSPDELRRYEVYRRSRLDRAAVRKIMAQVAGPGVPDSAVTAMMGMAKVFVGEVVEQGTCRARVGC